MTCIEANSTKRGAKWAEFSRVTEACGTTEMFAM
jgi:hypothetical protein